MLYTYLKKSKGYFDGTRVLIDGGKTFRDFIRANKESQKLIKKLIAQVSGVAVPIGPYESKTVNRASANAEESLRKLEQLGLEVSIEDSERKKRINKRRTNHESKNARRLRPPRYELPDASGPEDAGRYEGQAGRAGSC